MFLITALEVVLRSMKIRHLRMNCRIRSGLTNGTITVAGLLRPVAGLFVLLLLLVSAGCGVDGLAQIDAKVTQRWMESDSYEQQNAIEYLESGGRYYNPSRVPGLPDLDSEAILPLLKELKKEFSQEQYAIIEKGQDYAWSIVMKLPSDDSERERFEAYLAKAEEEFPGMILKEWGHEWITFHFLNEREAEMIQEWEEDAEAAS